jgi:pyridoxal-phosphate dependent enzyme
MAARYGLIPSGMITSQSDFPRRSVLTFSGVDHWMTILDSVAGAATGHAGPRNATVLDSIGDTPLIRVDGVWVKLKFLNPSGSIKARIAKYLIEKAEAEGLLQPGDTIGGGAQPSTSRCRCSRWSPPHRPVTGPRRGPADKTDAYLRHGRRGYLPVREGAGSPTAMS